MVGRLLVVRRACCLLLVLVEQGVKSWRFKRRLALHVGHFGEGEVARLHGGVEELGLAVDVGLLEVRQLEELDGGLVLAPAALGRVSVGDHHLLIAL